ncbi:MAG TPA: hypothetical protein VJJ73_01990 [Candidatus Paceibacterota bacterium]
MERRLKPLEFTIFAWVVSYLFLALMPVVPMVWWTELAWAKVVPVIRARGTIKAVTESTFTFTFHPPRGGVTADNDTTIGIGGLPPACREFLGLEKGSAVFTELELKDVNGRLQFDAWRGYFSGEIVYSDVWYVFVQTRMPTGNPIFIRLYDPDRLYSPREVGGYLWTRHIVTVKFTPFGNNGLLDLLETRTKPPDRDDGHLLLTPP